MKCVNRNHPNFKAIQAANNNNPVLANMLINSWQEQNGSDDIPTLEQLELNNNTKQNSTSVKPGVEELFESNPELANIGTQKQYSQYLDTIFPDSKVKDIVYHGAYQQSKLDNFLNKLEAFHKNAYYFLNKKTDYGDKFINAIVNIKNPSQGSTASSNFNVGDGKEKHLKKGFDGVIADQEDKFYINTSLEHLLKPYQETKGTTQKEIVVFEPEQIHILSSKKDLEMFRNFINFTKSEYAKYGDIQQFKDYIMSKNFAAIEEFLVVNNKIDRKC